MASQVTDEQRDEIRKAFALFDANGDGKITLDELERAMKTLGQEPTKLELNLLMKEADTDQSGAITYDEFEAYMSKPPKGRCSEEDLRKQFKLFDRDGDGFITREELMSITGELNLGSSFPVELIDQMFAETDLNKDGKISLEEYLSAMK